MQRIVPPLVAFSTPWVNACAAFASRRPNWVVRHGGRIAAALSATVVAVFLFAAVNDYQEKWAGARRYGHNLGGALAHDLRGALDQYAVALFNVARTLQDPAIAGLAPDLRSRLLFDRPSSIPGFLTRPFILDANGRLLYDSRSAVSSRIDLSGNEVFLRTRAEPGTRLRVGRPYDLQLTDDRVVGLGLRIADKDGRFGGTVMGGVRLAHLQGTLDSIQLGARDAVSLFRDDGTLLARRPEAERVIGTDFSANVTFQAASVDREIVAVSQVDGVRRLYVPTAVPGYPLVLTVGVAVSDIELPLFRRIAGVGAAILLLAAGLFVNTRLLVGELRRRNATETTIRDQVGALADAHSALQTRSAGEAVARAGLEAQLGVSQRLTALGQLAGGVALDVTEALQAIEQESRGIGEQASDPLVIARAQAITSTAEAAAAVAARLRAFAADPQSHVEMVDVADVVGETRATLEHALGADIQVVADVESGLPRLPLDPLQFEAVLVGLAVQGRDAMPRGGRLTLSVHLEAVRGNVEHEAGLGAGAYLRVAVADTGAAMATEATMVGRDPAAVAARGRAGGLGLTMARAYAEQTGGAFAISSSRRDGTLVTLWLKLTAMGADDGPSGSSASQPFRIERALVSRRVTA